MRLVVHRCNDYERNLIGKKCATREEQDDYLESNILYLQIKKHVPALRNTKEKILKDVLIDYDYTIHTTNHLTLFSEFTVMKSTIALQDDLTGIFDEEDEIEFPEYTQVTTNLKKKSVTDKANGYKDDMIRYYNFYVINQGTVYER